MNGKTAKETADQSKRALALGLTSTLIRVAEKLKESLDKGTAYEVEVYLEDVTAYTAALKRILSKE